MGNEQERSRRIRNHSAQWEAMETHRHAAPQRALQPADSDRGSEMGELVNFLCGSH